MEEQPVNIFWFRRDLRLNDNAALAQAHLHGLRVLCVFVYDKDILDLLPDKEDRRVHFISDVLHGLDKQLRERGSSLLVYHGRPEEVLQRLTGNYNVRGVYCNEDYEPYARWRDQAVHDMLAQRNISFHSFKDQCIFSRKEILKSNGEPYTVFTPYSRKWKARLSECPLEIFKSDLPSAKYVHKPASSYVTLQELGFRETDISRNIPDLSSLHFADYSRERDIPFIDGSRLGIHLRFGTVSIRQLVSKALHESETFLNELIWREFFMMILWHFPRVVKDCFKPEYNQVKWRNNEKEFEAWTEGQTGYPLVDAGMRQLKGTGYMHNRVRMVAASFLVKHLLIDWRWGEAWFAQHLNDFELSSNNGNWQWVAGCGCDAAPYFRIFNPQTQQKRFDPHAEYIKKWVPEYGTPAYPGPIVDHSHARERAISEYKKALSLSARSALF